MALRNMTQAGARFEPGTVTHWMDCGNKVATVDTNQRILDLTADELTVPADAVVENSIILPPCHIGSGARIVNSVVGPHVSIGEGTSIEDVRVSNSLIQAHSVLKNKVVRNAMIGNHARVLGIPTDVSLGDYNEIS